MDILYHKRMRDCKRNGKMRKFCCCKKVFCNTILTKSVYCDIIFCAPDNSGAENKIFIGVWLSLVECLVRDQEAGGSNPLTPTREKRRRFAFVFCLSSVNVGVSPQTMRKKRVRKKFFKKVLTNGILCDSIASSLYHAKAIKH